MFPIFFFRIMKPIITLYRPSGNGKCDTNTSEYKNLVFTNGPKRSVQHGTVTKLMSQVNMLLSSFICEISIIFGVIKRGLLLTRRNGK